MSLPEEESEHAEDDDERCWGLGRKTGEEEGESALRGEVASLCSSMETSISFARSCSQDSISTIKHQNNLRHLELRKSAPGTRESQKYHDSPA